MTSMATNENVRTYSNAAEITKYWIDNIAPRYFDMDNVNTYRAGTLGMNLDILSTVTEDTAHAMMLARREFYPNTAQYMKSLYKIAAAQFLQAPMGKPATANILLLIQQSDILKYGVTDGDLHTFVLDDTFVAYVDSIPFMLDYPIQILSVKKENGKYAHTTHYDFYINNSLSGDNERYLPNKVINYKGTEYLIISTTMRQIQKTYLNQLVTTNTIVNTITMDFAFDGTLANFEIFYTENDTSTRVQLEKRLADSGISKKPFCWYTIVDGNTIRITFPANVYFTPKLNSTISIEIATTLGSGGNFDSYESDIVSENASTRYPYNSQVPIFGTVDGASTGGEDIIDKEDYRLEVMRAFCTNQAFITVNDLQLYFNELMVGTKDKFKFTPKRDDAFIRLYGAFILMKDEGDNVIPTNTLDVILDPLEEAADFDIYSEAVGRFIIKPGSLFTYSHEKGGTYCLKRIHDAKLSDDISKYDNVNGLWKCSKCGYIYDGTTDFSELPDDYKCPKCEAEKSAFENDRFIFTNPYLISVSTDTFIAGYFMNSFTAHHSLSYTAVNDDSIVQFIAKHFKVERNAIAGENFYKFSVAISPSVDTINQETIYEEQNGTAVAKHNGYVESIEHNGTAVYATVRYTDDPALTTAIPEEEATEVIQVSSYLKKINQNFYVCPSCGAKMTVEEWEQKHEAGEFLDTEGNPIECENCVATGQEYVSNYESYELKYIDYEYYPGYDFKFAIGDKITKNDVLASAKPKDLGRIRLVMDLNGVMDSAAKRYVPMTLEEAHEESTTYYLFTAYIATDDMIDSSHIIQIQDGFAMQNGDDGHEYPISIPIEGLTMKLHAFYQYREDDDLGDDVKNPEHAYSSFNYLMGYTFTNTYELFEQDSITLVKPLDNVKGFLDEMERPQEPEPKPDPDPEPDPDHPPGEAEEIPDDYEHTVYLRTYDHNRFMTEEVDDDRVPHRYLTVDKTPEQMGLSAVTESETDNTTSSESTETQPSGEVEDPYGDNFVFHLRNCPVVSANWIKDAANEALLMDKLSQYYAKIETIIWDLENSFAIDMKFYNTYGKSKFYKIGNNTSLEILDSVNIWISFGVGINFPASADVFRDNFRTFVQSYIEATDDMVGNGINVYIMNLIAQAKTNFDEIAWLEYYGINNYGYDAQKLTIMSDDEILETVPADSFVPEFLNIIRETTTDGSTRPMVNIKILN